MYARKDRPRQNEKDYDQYEDIVGVKILPYISQHLDWKKKHIYICICQSWKYFSMKREYWCLDEKMRLLVSTKSPHLFSSFPPKSIPFVVHRKIMRFYFVYH